MPCIQCWARPPSGESKFCSTECRAEFEKSMAEAIACSLCDATADDIKAAEAEGWTDIEPDSEGTTWNYLGFCPECRDK